MSIGWDEMPFGNEAPVWWGLLKEFGFPVAVALAMMWAGWELIKILVRSHESLIHELKETLDRQAACLRQLAERFEIVCETQRQILEELRQGKR